jgi:hypothetical protein
LVDSAPGFFLKQNKNGDKDGCRRSSSCSDRREERMIGRRKAFAVLPIVVRSAPFCSLSGPHCEELLSWSKSHAMRMVSPTGNRREKRGY